MAKTIVSKTNKNLILFETALIVGLLGIFVENYLKQLPLNIYLKVVIIMLFFGGLFAFFFGTIEPFFEKTLSKILRRKKSFTKVLLHLIILVGLFVLYALFYFGIAVI